MIAGTLSRYFGFRFLKSVVGSFFGVVALAAMIDYVELLRRSSDWPKATALILAEISVFRVPQLSERIMPFAVLVGAMSCYLALSRRLELVVARAAGVSAWQFVAPSMVGAFLFGLVATTIYNPLAAIMHERSKQLRIRDDGRASRFGGARRQRRLVGASARHRRRGHHQCQVEPRARRPTQRRQRLYLRQRRPIPAAHRGEIRDARSRDIGASTMPASTPAASRRSLRNPIGSPPT